MTLLEKKGTAVFTLWWISAKRTKCKTSLVKSKNIWHTKVQMQSKTQNWAIIIQAWIHTLRQKSKIETKGKQRRYQIKTVKKTKEWTEAYRQEQQDYLTGNKGKLRSTYIPSGCRRAEREQVWKKAQVGQTITKEENQQSEEVKLTGTHKDHNLT